MQVVVAQCPILPTPAGFTWKEGNFIFDELQVFPEDLSEDELNFINNYLLQTKGLKLRSYVDQYADIEFVESSFSNNLKGKDQYQIDINSQQVIITFSTQASKMYALLSMVQMIEKKADSFLIHNATVVDYGKFEWRGLHLDVARHFFTVAEVKRFIDLMAFYKFNRFHWHLTDDQGWRIEIKKYPKLTEIGAFRDSTLNGHFNQVPRTYSTDRAGGFYTQEEIKDVVAYARMRNIEIVPEIEMPGHARAALAAYPELSCTGKQQAVPGLWGVFEDIFCSKPETISFLQDVLEEVVPLFPYDYVHIGGDEAPKMRWHECAKCQQIIKENGLKDEHELQTHFIQQMDDFLTSKGKKLIGWDEILEGGLSTNAAVMSWRGEQGGIDAANQNHNVVMSPTTYCYFDYYQSGDESEPLAIGGYLPLEKVYEYSPYPKELPIEKQEYILGGQANLWTEYIETFSQVEYMVYPRAIALMQSLWCGQKPSYDDFLKTYRAYHEPLLQKMNVNYSKSIYLPKMQLERIAGGVRYSFVGATADEKLEIKSELSDSKASFVNVFPSPKGAQKIVSVQASPAENTDPKKTKFVNILQHNGLGLDIELVTKPHEKYDHNGSLTLSDGFLGARPWKGDQWLGFNEDSVVLILNIPKGKTIDEITLGFLDAKGSWIYVPNRVDYFVAGKKGKWRKTQAHVVVSEYQKTKLDVKTRKLKVVIYPIAEIPSGAEGAGNRPWIFMDEVIINYKK